METKTSKNWDDYAPGRTPLDEQWRSYYFWLQEKGYRLRDLYHPDWVASWEVSPELEPLFCEDFSTAFGPLADAVRIADSKPVMLKMVQLPKGKEEIEIATLFSSSEYSTKDDNFCVPIYEVLEVPREPDVVLLVMPLLRSWHLMSFETLGEVLGFCRQVFMGLRFMHRNGIAHCDCKMTNLMMDGTPLFDEQPHPIDMNKSKDFSRPIRPYTRTQRPVRYYWIDFGLSYKHYPGNGPPLISSISCGDKTVPERSIQPPWNPFALDVYCVGNILKEHREFSDLRNRGFECLDPLLDEMTHKDPNERPTMEEVVESLEQIRAGLSDWKLRSHIRWQVEPFPFHVLFEVWHWFWQIIFIFRGYSPIPPIPPK